MKSNYFEIFAAAFCSWLFGFVLGLWRSTPYVTDREAGLLIALFITVTTIAMYKCISTDKAVDYLNRHIGEVHTMAILDLQEAHRKHIITVKSTYNQNMREAQNEIRRISTNFDRLISEYDYMTAMYQDQTRLISEQEDRIEYLEKRLKECRPNSSAASTPPFSAPASQIRFTNPPRRARAAVNSTSPLSQEPMVQVLEAEEE